MLPKSMSDAGLKSLSKEPNGTASDVDSRLKILWIDDKAREELAQKEHINDFFAIYLARIPSDIEASFREDRERVSSLRHRVEFYDFPRFPFDGYLCDFKLDEGPLPINKQSDPAELRKRREDARHVEAAGFTSAVLVSLSFEEHPAVIMPYSGYVPQILSGQYTLIRLLCDSTLVLCGIGEEERFSKSPLYEMLAAFSATYRASMPRWANEGWVHLAYSEKRRIVELASERSTEKGLVVWHLEDRMRVETTYQSRWIKLGALWFEGVDRRDEQTGFPVAEILAWLGSFPTPREEVTAAQQLADEYFNLSNHPDSMRRHKLSEMLLKYDKSEGATRQEIEPIIQNLAQALDMKYPDVLDTAFDVGAHMPGWKSQKHLVKATDNKFLRRLALLMLVVKEEYVRRVLMQQEITEALEPIRILLSQNARKLGVGVDRSFDLDVLKNWPEIPQDAADQLQTLFSYGIRQIHWSEGEIHLSALPRLEPQDMHRRLNPLPAGVRSRWDSLNKEIQRDGLYLKKLLDDEAHAGLEAEERVELKRYACEIGYPRSLWPMWLRD